MRERINNRSIGVGHDFLEYLLCIAAMLTGKNAPSEIADLYLERGAALVVIKLGPKGAYVKNRERETLAPVVPVARLKPRAKSYRPLRLRGEEPSKKTLSSRHSLQSPMLLFNLVL